MVLELCWIYADLLHLPVLLDPELAQLLILLVLRDGHVLLWLVHAGCRGAILHPLVHLHHSLQRTEVPCQSLGLPAKGLVISSSEEGPSSPMHQGHTSPHST